MQSIITLRRCGFTLAERERDTKNFFVPTFRTKTPKLKRDPVSHMQGKIFTITQERLDLLTEACRGHTSGECNNNPTIGACWDADRLDLGRAEMVNGQWSMDAVGIKRL